MNQMSYHFWKVISLGLLLLVLIFVAYPFGLVGYGAEDVAGAVADIETKYSDPKLSLDEVVAVYHKNVNEMFNKRIERLSKGEQPEKLETDDPDEHCDKYAGKISLRTYCMAREAMNELDGYLRALSKRKTYIESSEMACSKELLQKQREEIVATMNSLTPNDPTRQSYQNQLDRLDSMQSEYISEKTKGASATADFIDKEIERASMALDKAIGAYDEFQTAYPLHQEFENMILNLEKYLDALGKIRSEITKFPGKFINATTTQCT